jgi:hypothetical protein
MRLLYRRFPQVVREWINLLTLSSYIVQGLVRSVYYSYNIGTLVLVVRAVTYCTLRVLLASILPC